MTEAIADIDIVDIDEFAAERGFKKQQPSLKSMIQATGRADEIIAKMLYAQKQKHREDTLVEWLGQLGIVTTADAVRGFLRRVGT